MIATTANALFFLVTATLNLALWIFILRVLLQLTRADFYNPISQLVWRLTQPPTGWLARWLPRWKRLDSAAALLCFVLALVYVKAVASFDVSWSRLPWSQVAWLAILKLVSSTLNLYTLSLFALAVVSWIGPGVSNPAANVLWSLNEPLLRPVRRILPPIAGLDLSPIPVMLLLQFLDRLLPLGPFR